MSAEPLPFGVTFWGVRGTVPCPGPATQRYGGNTSCVEVSCGTERLIFDAGTGLRGLGKQMLAEDGPVRSHIFFTHTHIDHVSGLPFFKPGYDARNRFELWNGHLRRQGRSLSQVICSFMQTPLFPVPVDIMHGCFAFHDFAAGERLEPATGVVLRTAPLNHPGGATGYRIEFGGRSVCYVTDTEHREGELDDVIVELIGGSDLVIYDATYTEEEYPRYRGWGHSTWQEGVRLCEAASARKLVAFHHDPEHDDAALDGIARALAAAHPGSIVAREGLKVDV